MYRYDKRLDRLVGHSGLRGVHGHGFHDWMMDELELGARVALALGDPEQTFWNLEITFNRRRMIAAGILEPDEEAA